MSQLFAPLCSIAPTQRRRFLWAVWWSGPPTTEPFRKPDVFSGGAKSREEALEDAEIAAGTHVLLIESRWARAWGRMLVGLSPWPVVRTPTDRKDTQPGGQTPSRDESATFANTSIWQVLGVTSSVSDEELKRAFKARVLETHPDQGGSAPALMQVQRAYAEAQKRRNRPKQRKSPARPP